MITVNPFIVTIINVRDKLREEVNMEIHLPNHYKGQTFLHDINSIMIG